VLASLAGRDGSGIGAGEADKAMSLLKKAVGLGFRDRNAYRNEIGLENSTPATTFACFCSTSISRTTRS